MLSDMGAEGVKVQEVYGLEMLDILPQPVHALIFLFRYRAVDEEETEKAISCPDHVWFANQIPDFACATVALLNIVNNIKGLTMGRELRDFKEFTRDMDPISRGDAIDGFDFVRQIHNSFARENELLQADIHYKRKIERTKKRHALAKARETRKATKESKTPAKSSTPKDSPAPQRSSARTRKTPTPVIEVDSNTSSPLSDPPDSDPPDSDPPDSDPEFNTPSKLKKPPTELNVEANGEANGAPRRSARQPKPRQKSFAEAATVQEDDDDEGFHFIAYMPIANHVWRLDGLDKFPHDMGEFDAEKGDDWMNIAGPALEMRMALYAGGDLEFNLMAVVHDSVVKDRVELAGNVKALQVIRKKLGGIVEDWRELDGAETKADVLTGPSPAFKIVESDIDDAVIPQPLAEKVEKEDDLLKLIEIRKEIVQDQAPLRGAVRDAFRAAEADQEQAMHRRHDYGAFVRAWLGVLAENGTLGSMVEDAD